MVKDWKCIAAIIAIGLMIMSLIIVQIAAADRDDKHWGKGEDWKERSWHHGGYDRYGWSPGYYSSGYYSSGYYSPGYYSAPAYSYPVAVPVPVYVPVNYGGDPDACYRACMASGQYSPNQCARSCFSTY